jgi:ATP/maltotriose-dependent transcriptional regulator MalT
MDEAREFLDAHDGSDLPPDHPMAARVAMVLAQRGRLQEAIVLAASLRTVDPPDPAVVTAVEADAIADIVGARIWVSWLEQRIDQVAVDVGRRLVGPGSVHPLETHRRLTVLHSVAAALMAGPDAGDPLVIAEARDYLSTARALAVIFDQTVLECACTARLALLHVPGGELATARSLALLALAPLDGLEEEQDDADGRVAHIRFMAEVVVQWARHYQGQEMDGPVLARIREQLPRFAFDLPASIVAGHVLAAEQLEHGDVRVARRVLTHVLGWARFPEMGVWRYRPLITDAYLAAMSGDEQRAQERLTDLARAGAPGEALLVRATNLLALGDNVAALAALGPVTSGQVRHAGLTFPVACALEAMLLEQSGQHVRADQSMRRAIGAAEPSGALRLFAMHDPAVVAVIVERAVAARPHDRWARQILDFLRGQIATAAAPIVVQRHEPADPVAPALALQAGAEPTASPLTERERQVLAMVNAGASQAQMARELYVSLNTIKTHLRSIRQKLGVERTGEAAAVARGAGWLDEPG